MKLTPHVYARALAEVLKDSASSHHASMIKKFVEVVHRRGDGRLLPEILAAFADIERKARGGRLIEVAFARRVKRSLVDNLRRLFRKEDDVVFRTVPELVAGVRITIDGEREFDHSLERRINKLFVR